MAVREAEIREIFAYGYRFKKGNSATKKAANSPL